MEVLTILVFAGALILLRVHVIFFHLARLMILVFVGAWTLLERILVKSVKVEPTKPTKMQTLFINHSHFCYLVYDCTNVKIGIAVDPHKRLKQLQTGSSAELRLLGIIGFDSQADARYVERILHKKCGEHSVRGEWFAFDPTVEEFFAYAVNRGLAWAPAKGCEVEFVVDGQNQNHKGD